MKDEQIEKLEKLVALKEKGALSDDEFNTAKERILNSKKEEEKKPSQPVEIKINKTRQQPAQQNKMRQLTPEEEKEQNRRLFLFFSVISTVISLLSGLYLLSLSSLFTSFLLLKKDFNKDFLKNIHQLSISKKVLICATCFVLAFIVDTAKFSKNHKESTETNAIQDIDQIKKYITEKNYEEIYNNEGRNFNYLNEQAISKDLETANLAKEVLKDYESTINSAEYKSKAKQIKKEAEINQQKIEAEKKIEEQKQKEEEFKNHPEKALIAKTYDGYWSLGGFDHVPIIKSLKISNTANFPIKDFSVKMQFYTPSGSLIDSCSQVVYQKIPAKGTYTIRGLNMGCFVNSQVQSANIEITSAFEAI